MISLAGARSQPYLNQLYFKSEKVIKNRPLYIDNSNQYAVWFDGSYHWRVGYRSNVDQGWLTSSLLTNDEMVDCPVDSEKWEEYYSESWTKNNTINFKCEGMFENSLLYKMVY